ncbi:hypothetical protein AVEN_9586-1 [Araneus ventricosus]|uniref:Uncharacterized protein n=1 Tax=Araneus ventricosus TaxID=182803 RepID=A0A4Y2HA00_ARAVE|nr:hypothetical protein AVEN_9586-1 [Araneus ventricosus]
MNVWSPSLQRSVQIPDEDAIGTESADFEIEGIGLDIVTEWYSEENEWSGRRDGFYPRQKCSSHLQVLTVL